MCFANTFFIATLIGGDYPAFISVYLILPYTLLFARLAFRKSSFVFAGLAGLTWALPFYVLASHPGAVIHGSFVIACYLVFLIVFTTDEGSFLKRLELSFVVCATVALVSADYVAPLIVPVLQKESIVQGHGLGASVFLYGVGDFGLVFHIIVQPLLNSFGILFVLGITEAKSILARKENRGEVVFFFLLCLWLLQFIIAGNDGPFAKLILLVTSRITFLSYQNRLPIYLFLAGFVVALAGLDVIVRHRSLTKLSWLVIVAISAAILTGTSLFGGRPSLSLVGIGLLLLFLLLGKVSEYEQNPPDLNWTYLLVPLPFLLFIVPFFPTALNLRNGVGFDTGALPSVHPYTVPDDKRTYIELAAILANYRNLQGDPSTWHLIRDRLVKFEQDFVHSEYTGSYWDVIN